MTDDDPYGLPTFPGEGELAGWVDHSEIAMRDVRVFTCGTLTATLIHHPGLWDLILSDGHGGVEYFLPQTEEIAAMLTGIREAAGR